ncbi:hypothetical protein G6F24_017800 [Rhizopus arrhizus]|nr:hypothetical protein G6F24_017800 [Rhizopus arrhizus]
MGLHEGLHAREQGSAVALGLEDGRRRLLQAQFDVPDDRVFQQMPVVAQHRFVAHREGLAAQGLERGVCASSWRSSACSTARSTGRPPQVGA